MISANDTAAWMRLANLQLPARLANSLIDAFDRDPRALFAASADEWSRAATLSPKQAQRLADPSFLPTDAQIAYLHRAGVQVVHRGADLFPRPLLDIPDPPTVLFVRGRLDERDRFAVGVVGSRHASPYGRTVTTRLARDIAAAGLTVVSGGAIGIDTCAHQAAVAARGRTIVVLGCGLDIDYPRENQELFGRIAAEDLGAVITEFPLGATPEPWRFPMRNRIISGLSMGLVVVEAGTQSGALLTANIAAEHGRDVMAVPGNVDRPGSRGTNGLIRDGAVLVETAQDVLRTLGVLALEAPDPPAAREQLALTAQQRKLVENLSLTPKHLDMLAAESGIPTVEAGVEMTMLELTGIVRRLPGNCYIRVL